LILLAGTLLSLSLSLSLSLPLVALAQGVGIARLTTNGAYQVPLAVWYPSPAPTTDWDAGPYRLHATRDAPVAAGRHALVVVSHGSGGSELGHADLAEALARSGYIVAAPRHLGDSYDQPQGRGSDVQLTGRPWQAVATLDAVLADARFAPAIDAQRIGMAGFSAGGYTTLVMAGARPDLALHVAHCQRHADDAELCFDGARTTLAVTRPGWALPQDTRVRAAVAMAPLSVMFDAKGLAGVTIPLRIYKAANDQMLQNRFNTDPLLRAFARPVEQAEVPGGHFVFLAPCSDALKAAATMICADPPGVDRAAVHEKLNAEIVDFFNRTLAP
jgi:predicted dienelactone hydrolase